MKVGDLVVFKVPSKSSIPTIGIVLGDHNSLDSTTSRVKVFWPGQRKIVVFATNVLKVLSES